MLHYGGEVTVGDGSSLDFSAEQDFGLSTAAFAWALAAGRAWWRLAALLSVPFLMALYSVQWSPLFTAALLVPALLPLAVVKPQLGLALAAAGRWTWRTVVTAAGIVVASNGYVMKISPRQNRSMFVAAITGFAGVCGGASAILAGDWLHARSMHLVGKYAGPDGLDVFCKSTTGMVDGEFLQLRYVADPKITEEQYFSVIYRKKRSS